MTTARVVVALLAGLVVFLLLFPGSGVVPDIPRCFSAFGYEVPCESGVAIVAGVATAGMIGVVLWVTGRRRPDR